MRRGFAVALIVTWAASSALHGVATAKPKAAPTASATAVDSAAPTPPPPGSSSSATTPSSSSASVAATPPASSSVAPSVSGSVSGCVETIPTGAQRPAFTESFPTHGLSGYAATLVVTVHHGKGETVLPRGLELQSESEAAKALKDAGFTLPDQNGPGAARLQKEPLDPKHPERIVTHLELPLLALPPEPGRHTLTLPPLPVAVSRANGDIVTACTHSHAITIEDPISSTPNAMPKPNPPPRPQREEWTSLRRALTYGAAGLAVGALLAYLFRKWQKRPKPAIPPAPPRPPWEIALEKLDEVRYAGLLEVKRYQDYFDRVNDAVRAYLGARYGFDGLESTTDEILQVLRRGSMGELALPAVVEFLEECDLVKFANLTPAQAACVRSLEAAERIVRSTMPRGVLPEIDGFNEPPPGPPPVTPTATSPSTPPPAAPPHADGEPE